VSAIFSFLSVVESGNPGGLPATYSGTVSDFSNAESVIFRPPLTSDKQQQAQHADVVNDYRLLRTEQDSKWLNGNLRCSAFNGPSLCMQLSFYAATTFKRKLKTRFASVAESS